MGRNNGWNKEIGVYNSYHDEHDWWVPISIHPKECRKISDSNVYCAGELDQQWNQQIPSSRFILTGSGLEPVAKHQLVALGWTYNHSWPCTSPSSCLTNWYSSIAGGKGDKDKPMTYLSSMTLTHPFCNVQFGICLKWEGETFFKKRAMKTIRDLMDGGISIWGQI